MNDERAILLLAAEPDHAADQAERLRVRVTGTVHKVSLRDRPPMPNKGWRRRRRETRGRSSSLTTRLAALCRESGVTVAVACDDASARVARTLVDEVPGMLALFGVDAAIRALNLPETGTPPGGSVDDVLGRTRFVGDSVAGRWPGGAGSPAPRLVIGPDNWDGRAAAWALLAEPSHAQAIAVQVVDGGDFLTAPADLSISRAEWADPVVADRFSNAVMVGTTHVLHVGPHPLLPAGHAWPRRVTVGMVLDVVDLMMPGEIDAVLAELPKGADDSRVSRWKERTGLVARRMDEHAGSVMVTDRALAPRLPTSDVLPLAVPSVAASAIPAAPAGAPPLVVTARPDVDLGFDPVADAVRGLAARGACRHVSLSGLSQSMWLPAIRAADVLVDRVWLPGLGTAGVTALAMGRTVVSRADGILDGAATVGATLSTLPQTLADVLSDASVRVAAAEQGVRTADQRRKQARQALGRFVSR